MKKQRPIRADSLRQSMNNGKSKIVLAFIQNFRKVAVELSHIQWDLFFKTGSTDKDLPATHLNSFCGSAAVQMARHQVVEQIEGWLSNRANEFATHVYRSSLPLKTKKELYKINKQRLWFFRDKNNTPVAPALARTIMRHVMSKHRKPNVSNISPRLDARLAIVSQSKTTHADLWTRLKFPFQEEIFVPIHTHAYFSDRGGDLCKAVQLCTDKDNNISIRLMQDMTLLYDQMKAEYTPKMDVLGLDFGLRTMTATSQGTLFGQALYADLKRIDKQILGIDVHRKRTGQKLHTSKRYKRLVARIRGMIKTCINMALNRIVAIHAPRELRVEQLDFRFSKLSKTTNRIIRNCGRSVFKAKLNDLSQKYGIIISEVQSPYTSQECSACHYVDSKNRDEDEFACRFCGNAKHADVNAARVIIHRRPMATYTKMLTKGAILDELVSHFIKRYNRLSGGSADPRLSNPYFRDWSEVARKLL